MSNFSKNIKELRVKKGLTQQDIAKLVDVTPTGVSYWESGKSVPSSDVLKTLANYFGVTVDFLVGQSEISLEDEKLILFRKAEQVPEEDRGKLYNIIDSTIDIFLKSKNGE